LGTISKNPLPNPWSWRLTPTFSSKSFIILALPCRSVNHLELISIVWSKGHTSSFPYGYAVVPVPFAEEKCESFRFILPFQNCFGGLFLLTLNLKITFSISAKKLRFW
jgi:hypothetical protein